MNENDEAGDQLNLPMTALKLGITAAVSVSVKHVVKGVIEKNVDIPDGRYNKAKLTVGAYVIGAFIADKIVDYADERIDKMIETAKHINALAREQLSKDLSTSEMVQGFFKSEPKPDLSQQTFDSTGLPTDPELPAVFGYMEEPSSEDIPQPDDN